MFKRYVCLVALMINLSQVTSCAKNGTYIGGDENLMSGVAATGAPISGGKIRVKGSDGKTTETTTNSDGSYEANVEEITEPYLVQVEAPSGEKYISVASKSALAEGKKINVTPISHLIVSKVFEKADADDLFENFTTDSAKFTEEKLEEKKGVIFQAFKNSGLIGPNGVVDDSVDLLNGDLLAGTSQGLDGLLDVIQLTSGSTAGSIAVQLKSGTPVLTIIPNSTAAPVVNVLSPTVISESRAQLDILGEIRIVMNEFTALHTNYSKCSGSPKDDGSACDVDTIADDFLKYFHPDFQEDGSSREAAVWDWICANDNDDWILSKSACLAAEVDIPVIVLKDVSLISYNSSTTEAAIGINVYIDGKLEGSEDFYLKKDNGKFKLLGNKKTFRYWIDTESVFKSDYASGEAKDDFSVIVSMCLDDASSGSFDGDEVFKLEAISGNSIFPSGSSSASSTNLYLVTAPVHDDNGSCQVGVAFAVTDKPYKIMLSNGSFSYGTYSEACGTSNPCTGCSSFDDRGNSDPSDDVYTWAQFDWESNKLSLTEDQVLKMSKTERIRLTSVSGVSGTPIDNEFIIRRPLVINQFNVGSIVPTFGKTVAQFCQGLSFSTGFDLAVSTGYLSDVSLFLSYRNDQFQWGNATARESLDDQSVSTLSWQPQFNSGSGGSLEFPFANLYLSSRDDLGRRFVRQVSCSP